MMENSNEGQETKNKNKVSENEFLTVRGLLSRKNLYRGRSGACL